MAVNRQLLAKARAAGARLAEAEHQVDLARKDYHSVVRRMHLAGGSLRELAAELGLSHQRIQQMVSGAGGSWWQSIWSSRNLKGNLVCTFCGLTQDKVARLIAGPKVFICDACVALAQSAMKGGLPAADHGPLALAGRDARTRCSFCGKRKTPDRALLTGAANICDECLSVCRQILVDSSPE
jgi:hypothetical protein